MQIQQGSTWVKIDTRNSATRPFLSREFSTHCLLSSDGHFHKIKFILRHATFWKRNRNDMRHFNINMIWHPTPQITYNATPDRLNASTAINSTIILLWSGYVVPHTDPQASVWLYHVAILRFVLTAKNVNNTSLLSVSFRPICLFFVCLFVCFRNGKLRKGKRLGNISFCLNIHWCWWNRNCKYKYKHAYSIKKTALFFFSFFFLQHVGARNSQSRLQVW